MTDRFHVRRFVITNLRLHVVWVYHRFKGTDSINNIEGFLDGKLTPGYCKDLLRKIWKADWAPRKVGAPAADNSNSKKRKSLCLLEDSDDEAHPLADELSAYLGSISPPKDACPLAWWRLHKSSSPFVAHRWPAPFLGALLRPPTWKGSSAGREECTTPRRRPQGGDSGDEDVGVNQQLPLGDLDITGNPICATWGCPTPPPRACPPPGAVG